MTEEPQQQEPEPPAVRASDADRERVAAVLRTAMGEGRITMAELEERLAAVYAAATLPELAPVIADLPGASSAVVGAAPKAVYRPHELIGGVPGSARSVAIMSGTERKGSWVIPPQHNSFAFWGGVKIDLRRAMFAEQHTTITAVAIMGGITIVVPEDIRVQVDGVGVMGAFEATGEPPLNPDPAGPIVRVTGFAFWGGVEVKYRPRKEPPPKHLMI